MSTHTFPDADLLKQIVDEGATVALFDSDITCYAIGFKAKDDANASQVESAVDNFMHRVKRKVDADYYLSFLTDGKSNYRIEDAKTAVYKGNREGSERPQWYPHIKQYLQDVWKSQLMVGIEADDALTLVGNYLSANGVKVVLCSLDKDLLQFPCTHYNWDRDALIKVDYAKGQRNLWKQVIIGDVATDNIPGLSDSAWVPQVPFKVPVFETYMKVPSCPKINANGKPSTRKMAHSRFSHYETITDKKAAKALPCMYYGEARAKAMLDAAKVEDYASMVLTEYVDAYWAEAEAQGYDDPAELGIQRFNEVFRLVYMLREVDEIPNGATIDFTPLPFQAKNFEDFAEDDTDADDPDFDF